MPDDLTVLLRQLRADVDGQTRSIKTLVETISGMQATMAAILKAITATSTDGEPLAAHLKAITEAIDRSAAEQRRVATAINTLRTELPAALSKAGSDAAAAVLKGLDDGPDPSRK